MSCTAPPPDPRARGANPQAQILPEHRVSCHVMQCLNRIFTRIFHNLHVIGRCRLPKSGPAILICNHTSGLDPHLIQACCPRLITWMMAREYYEQPVLKTLLDQLGVIPVTRSGRDMSAMRAAMRALENRQLLGIFPEGRIETTHELLPFQTGVALMAMKQNVPVYPAYLDGTQRNRGMLHAFFGRQRAVIAFGDEIRFDRSDQGRESQARATAAMQAAVEKLRLQTLSLRPPGGW